MSNLKYYDILYIDPPWQFNKRSNTSTKFGGGAMAHYSTMPMSEIKALDFSLPLKPNALVYCWITLAKLQECITAIQSPTLKLVATGFVWIKTNPKLSTSIITTDKPQIYYQNKGYSKPFYGVGNYTASNAEICLIFRKGKMLKYENKVSQVIISPRDKHSKKPIEAYDKLETMYPHSKFSKLELFARNTMAYFDTIGDELNNINVKDFLNKYKDK